MAKIESLPTVDYNICKILAEFSKHAKAQKESSLNKLVLWKGTYVLHPMNLSLPYFDSFIAYESDVVICGVAKSGASRFSALVGSIMNHDDPEYMYREPDLQEKVPWLDFCTALVEKGPMGVDWVSRIPPPRAYWTRVNIDGLPPKVYEKNARIVYHFRHPKDIMVSQYYHYVARAATNKWQGDIGVVVDKVLNDQLPCCPFFDHFAKAWNQRNNPNVYLCSFEEFSEKPEESIRNLAKFLERDLTDEVVKRIAFDCHRDQMERNNLANHYNNSLVGEFDFDRVKFIRCGIPGGWKSEIPAEHNKRINAWMLENLKRPELEGIAERFPSTFSVEDL